jgi:hypothetical protein
MAGVAIVIALALLEYSVFVWLCGQARGRYDVPAPSTVGNTTYERYFRVQMNTVEHLVMFVPGMWLFGTYVSTSWAMGLGVVFIVGRAMYARAYLSDDPTRIRTIPIPTTGASTRTRSRVRRSSSCSRASPGRGHPTSCASSSSSSRPSGSSAWTTAGASS